MLSKTSRYGLRAVLFLASNTNENMLMGVKSLSHYTEISEPMLSKILQFLTRNEIIQSKKGRNGGFYMTASQKKSELRNVIKIMEQSDYIISNCMLGLKDCKDCPYANEVERIRKEFKSIYATDSILETSNKLNLKLP